LATATSAFVTTGLNNGPLGPSAFRGARLFAPVFLHPSFCTRLFALRVFRIKRFSGQQRLLLKSGIRGDFSADHV